MVDVRRQAVYTANFGKGYDDPKPILKPNPSWDYIYFTDDVTIIDPPPGWTKLIHLPLSDNPRYSAKQIKILPHIYLPEYYRTIWIDSSYEMRGNPDWIAEGYRDSEFVATIHPSNRTDIYHEAETILKYGFDSYETITHQIEKYRQEEKNGFDGTYKRSVFQCGVLYRRNTHSVKLLMERWMAEIGGKNSIRDQISLPYVIWKTPKEELPKINRMAQLHLESILKYHPHNKKINSITFMQPWGFNSMIGQRINEEISRINNPDEWIVLMDQDVCVLTDGFGVLLNNVINRYPDTELFGAYCNRIGLKYQLLEETSSENYDMTYHHNLAKERLEKYYSTCSDINKPVAGFFMMFPKRVWNKYKFQDKIIDVKKEKNGIKGLYFDYSFGLDIIGGGGKVRLIEGVYLYHHYRVGKKIKDVSHLLMTE